MLNSKKRTQKGDLSSHGEGSVRSPTGLLGAQSQMGAVDKGDSHPPSSSLPSFCDHSADRAGRKGDFWRRKPGDWPADVAVGPVFILLLKRKVSCCCFHARFPWKKWGLLASEAREETTFYLRVLQNVRFGTTFHRSLVWAGDGGRNEISFYPCFLILK